MDSDQSASDLFCIKGDLQEAGGEKRGKHIFRKGKKAEIERRAGSRIMMQKSDYDAVEILDLQQLKGRQQLAGGAVPSVDLEVLQLRREPRRPVMLVAHLDRWLRERSADEFGLSLHHAEHRHNIRGTKGG